MKGHAVTPDDKVKEKVDTIHPQILFHRVNEAGDCGDIRPTEVKKMASRQREQKEHYSFK